MKNGKLSLALKCVAGGGIVAACFGPMTAHEMQPDENIQFTLNEKSVKNQKFLLMTDAGIFQNTDSVAHDKGDFAELQNRLKAGCTYDAVVYGFRSKPLGMYKNVVDAKHIPTPACPSPK